MSEILWMRLSVSRRRGQLFVRGRLLHHQLGMMCSCGNEACLPELYEQVCDALVNVAFSPGSGRPYAGELVGLMIDGRVMAAPDVLQPLGDDVSDVGAASAGLGGLH